MIWHANCCLKSMYLYNDNPISRDNLLWDFQNIFLSAFTIDPTVGIRWLKDVYRFLSFQLKLTHTKRKWHFTWRHPAIIYEIKMFNMLLYGRMYNDWISCGTNISKFCSPCIAIGWITDDCFLGIFWFAITILKCINNAHDSKNIHLCISVQM